MVEGRIFEFKFWAPKMFYANSHAFGYSIGQYIRHGINPALQLIRVIKREAI